LLADRLRARIERDGPLSFHALMQAALYDPAEGYYTTLETFRDYLTSPEVHPAFGLLLGRQVVDVWEALDRPRPLRVLEVGAGTGALAASLLGLVREHGLEVEYAIDEPSPSLRAVQQRRLGDREVSWTASDQRWAHVVIANEVADALPVYRVVVRDGLLRELRVGLDSEGAFRWVEAEDVPARVRAYFDALGLRPPEGAVAEVSTDLADWAQHLAARLERGLLLVLDYGYPAEALFGRTQGTLLTYYRHTLGSDPLVRLGQQDISVHVDFSTLARAARAAGLDVVGVTSQRTLLRNLGILAVQAAMRAPGDRAALAQLTDPRGLGRIGALFATRDLPGYQPVGLRGGRTWPPPAYLPQRPAEPDDLAFVALWREAFGPPHAEQVEEEDHEHAH
jgi:SAM-dependent MidA family methyltransferase